MKTKLLLGMLIAFIILFSFLSPSIANYNITSEKIFGVMVQNLNGDLSIYFHLKKNQKGVLITKVYDKSPAFKAGLKVGDIITAIGDKITSDSETFSDILNNGLEESKNLKINLIREGKSKKVTVIMPQVLDKNDTDDEEIDLENLSFPNVFIDKDDIADIYAFAHGWRGPHNFLGIRLQNLTEGLKTNLNYNSDVGVLIDEVIAASPAEKAGLKSGDILLKINDTEVHSSEEVSEAINNLPLNSSVKIKISRKGEIMNVKTKLISKQGKYYKGYVKPFKNNMKQFKFRYQKEIEPELKSNLQEIKKEMKQLKEEMKEIKKELDKKQAY